MLRVGLTGGLATGKSFVGEALADLGCHLIQADELGHEVLLPWGEAYEAVVEEFGPGILEKDRTINRRKLAAEVFGQPGRLETLNRLVHPPVVRRVEELAREFSRRDPEGILVVETAILIETGYHQRFDRVILVVCDEERQVERATHRDRATRQAVLARIQRQMPLEEKRKLAHYVIDTCGAREDTLQQVKAVYESLRSIQP